MPFFEFISKKRVPQRVKVCALATGVVMFCYIQRISYLSWIKRVHDLNTSDWMHSKSNCSYIITSWEEYITRDDTLPDFYWDVELIYTVTQSFYLGYMLSVIPAGIAVDFYGPRCLLLLGLFISSVSTIAFPFLAKVGPFEGMSAMLCQGIGQGTLYAGVAVLTAQWAPVTERTRFVSMTESGKLLGVVVAGLIPRVFHQLDTYWEVRFVLPGLLGLLLAAACWFYLCNRPAHCTHISTEEKDYIHQNCEGLVHKEGYRLPFVPWKRMFLTPCFLSLVLYSSSTDWLHGFMLAKLDSYIHNVVHFDRELIFVVYYTGTVGGVLCTWYWGVASDLLINNKYLSRTANRKLSGLIAMSVSVLMMFLTLVADCDDVLVVACQTAFFFSRGFVYSTVHAIPIDLSPHYTGATMAIVNFGGYFAVLLIREIYNSVIEESSDYWQWWKLLSIMMGVSVVGTLQFLVLGSAEVQSWNYAEPRNSRDSNSLTLNSVITRSSTRSPATEDRSRW